MKARSRRPARGCRPREPSGRIRRDSRRRRPVRRSSGAPPAGSAPAGYDPRLVQTTRRWRPPMLRRLTPLLAAAALPASAATAHAALKPGDAAPLFTTDAAVGGKQMPLVLADALKKGPVVLYFFPKSFTSGCTLEAHLFAEATEQVRGAGRHGGRHLARRHRHADQVLQGRVPRQVRRGRRPASRPSSSPTTPRWRCCRCRAASRT